MKRAVIIGATSGIGKEVARILLSEGWKVGISGRREDLLIQMQSEAPESVEYEVIDITRQEAPQLLGQLISKLGGMDLYLHSAGYGRINPGLDPELEMKTIKTNVFGFVTMIDCAFNYFRQQKHGYIAAITSVAGRRGLGLNAAYSSTKRFQMTYLTALAQLSNNYRYNIRISDIQPGFVNTAFLSHSYPLRLKTSYVAGKIVKGLMKGRRCIVIDWRYRIVVFVWHLIPGRLWEHINLERFVRK
ncbi:MAG: SDR family NAD(P)-dependent oxidoreductase [Bacteroidales bacterium]|jgi:short-subunit dehydrogenase|nr:SDR family NAD(P)-dependent oxidoreductase [Bacteroidales bacterium]MDD2264288.1 SDR family NAD(P)-dependent oxidoreductase [Bacteroidales bacterium]MDD2831522.1 SDR family NAD(P)-dependent oxidoreductase [Bacteroidales bacterium]MDD3208516.1 SDR family NAD(P)-dependent oxidoreductase [Bacteroidales bacterium]MDD3697071.1 SDR family NAD(P)-dependent oxidoreductase [Bacteroidales bacterium]